MAQAPRGRGGGRLRSTSWPRNLPTTRTVCPANSAGRCTRSWIVAVRTSAVADAVSGPRYSQKTTSWLGASADRRRAAPEDARHLDLLPFPVGHEGSHDVGELRLRRHPEPAALVAEREPLPVGQDLDDPSHPHRAALEGPGVLEQLGDRDLDRPPAERLVELDARRRCATQHLPDALHREAHVPRDLPRDDARPELGPREHRGAAHREREAVGADERVRDLLRHAARQRRCRLGQPGRVRERDEDPPVARLALDLEPDEPDRLVPDRAHVAEGRLEPLPAAALAGNALPRQHASIRVHEQHAAVGAPLLAVHQEQLQHAGVVLGQPLAAFRRVAGFGRRTARERRGNEEETRPSRDHEIGHGGIPCAKSSAKRARSSSSACRARCRARSSADRGRRGGRGDARRGRPAGSPPRARPACCGPSGGRGR